MAHIRLDDKEIELSVGELWVGVDDGSGVRFGSASSDGNLAIIAVDPRGTATVRRATSGVTVLVNGVALGAEPAPLLHGDRIEVAGRQLRFSDDRKAGSTLLMPAFGAPATMAGAPQRGRAAVSGGRLVSLVDGREYTVPPGGLRIGRDASCDVVVPGTDVSRQHAGVSLRPAGYILRDLSANGVYVNSARIGDAQPLRRGDIIRVGGEEFRFYADESSSEAPGPDVRLPSSGAPDGRPASAGTTGGTRVVVGLKPPHPKRAPAARPVGTSRAPKRTERGASSRGVPAAVWLAAAALIGATVLLVLQDR
ncbi:MAG TPA: FHA domain-containing protein [Gemmatimonadaceae bacterium]|jgi:hypothetical protein|nr:FHA domain-containing protein [Gemmatimonadaceae bacterium]